jgi:hypothetical protein
MRVGAALLAVLATLALSTAANTRESNFDPNTMRTYAAIGWMSLFAPFPVSWWAVPAADNYAKTWPGAKGGKGGKKGKR